METSAESTSTTTTRPSFITLALAVGLAAILTGALFLSPIGLATAQESEEDTTEDTAPADEDSSGFGDLPDEEREERREERQERREEREAAREDALQLFADELGVSVEEVEAAGLAVLESILDEKVAEDRITQTMADEILERAEERGGIPFVGARGPGGHGGGPFGR
ncbi:hypothetical protein [Euzebya tangerina]|uniref:hypothetical protein n=1 Tax=Euzebya tangerina TaxID=591198 RepID=UPI0013C330E0|nr:hypothetical protein [Euzebya tangerina]